MTTNALATGTTRYGVGRGLYLTMSLVALVIVLAGFVPGILNPARRLAPLTILVSVHGIVFFAWLVLFFVQTTLVATGRTAIHRRFGMTAIVLAVIMIPLGYASAIAMARRGFDLSGDLKIQADPLGQLVFPLGDLVTFAILVPAGLWYRRRTEIHKRLMLLGTIGSMMPAPLAHFLGHNLPSATALIVPILAVLFLSPALYDRIRFGRFHRVSLWCGILVFLWANVRATVIGPSEPWHQFARWLIN